MSEKVTYCWCDMCGFNAKVKAGVHPTTEDQIECPDCKSLDMFSILEFGPEIPEHMAEDDDMQEFTP